MKFQRFSVRSLETVFVLLLLVPQLAAQSLATQPTHLVTPGMAVQSPSAPAGAGGPRAALTLEELEQMALANNPTLGEAKAEVDAAAGRTRQAGVWPNPKVGYTGEEIRGGSFHGGQQGAFVEQPVILGGKLGLDRKVAASEEKEAEEQQREQQLRVKNAVRIAFYRALAAEEMVDVRGKLSGLAKDGVETTRQLQNVGQADLPDLLEAQVEADEADLALTAAEQRQQSAWQTLAAVAGKPDLPPARLAGNLEDFPQLDPDQILQGILRDSPALKIAQLEAERTDLALARARREVAPDLYVRAGYLDNLEQLEATSPPAVGSEGFAEVGVNVPLFNRNQGNIAAARAERERAEFEAERVSLGLRQSAAPALQNYLTARAAAERYKLQSIPTATRAYQMYLERYREGGAAYPQVLIAQKTVFELETSYVSALESVWVNATALQGLLLTDGLDRSQFGAGDYAPAGDVRLP